MKRSLSVVLLLAAFVGTCLAIWHGVALKPSNGLELEAERQIVRPVPTACVIPAPTKSIREFPAVVQATRRVEMSFPVEGVLVELHGEAGRVVEKGEVIARLDPRDHQNALNAAKASYNEALLNLERTRTLRQQNVTTQSELDNAEAVFEKADAQLRISSKAVEDVIMRAPFDGVVAKRYVENHEHIAKNTPVLSLQGTADLEISFQVPENLIAEYGQTLGENVQVRFTANGEWRDARVVEVGAEADSVSRTYEVVAAVRSPRTLKVLPGMTAMARLTLPSGIENRDSVMVPLAAVLGGSDGDSYVWVVEGSQARPRKKMVTLGSLHADGVEVLTGLEVGQLVAVAGLHSLEETMLVRPLESGCKGGQ